MTRLHNWMAIGATAAIALNGLEANASPTLQPQRQPQTLESEKRRQAETPRTSKQPQTSAPQAAKDDTTSREAEPEASSPQAQQPSLEPDVAEPEASPPQAQQPSLEPDVAEPEASSPQAQQPSLEAETAPKPDVVVPDLVEPETADPIEAPREAPASPEEDLPRVPLFPQPSDLPDIDPDAPPPPYLNPHPNFLRFPTFADEVELDGTQPISLQQALALAARNNLDLKEARLSLASSRASLRQAEASWFPNLDLTSNLTFSDSASSRISIERQEALQGVQSPLQSDPTSVTWNNELQLSYDLYTFGRRAGQVNAAEGEVRVDQLELERVLEDLLLDVKEAYYDVQQADMDVLIARSAVANSQQSLEDAQELEAAGVRTQFEVLRAEVQLANDQQQLNQALSDQRVSRRALAEVLNLSQSVDIAAADPVDLAGVWELSLEDSIVLALRNRAELEQQLVQRDIAQDRQRIARARVLPQLSVFGTVNLIDVSDDLVGGLTEGYSAGVQFQWRLFDGGAAAAAARQEELAEEAAAVRFARLRNQVRLQVEQAYYQLEARLLNVQRATTALTLAEESLDLARLRFEAGVGTQTEVIDAQDDLTQAQGNLVEAILGYNRSLAQIRRAVSNLPLRDELDDLGLLGLVEEPLSDSPAGLENLEALAVESSVESPGNPAAASDRPQDRPQPSQ